MDEDLIIDEEVEDGDPTKLKEKLEKVKERIRSCEGEKKEYLDGWQRMKADYANFKREVGEREKEDRVRAIERVVRDLLPVLESMDHARSHVKDLAPIEMQLLGILKEYGLEQFGKVGEAFDPSRHEAIGTIEVEVVEKENIILELVNVGYKLGDKVIRAPKVKIGKLKID